MLTHLLHLLLRSIESIPTALGSTWLGIVFPVAVTGLGQLIGFLFFGWQLSTRNWKKTAARGLGALAAAYCLLFSWCVMSNIYKDHLQMARALDSYQEAAKGVVNSTSVFDSLVISPLPQGPEIPDPPPGIPKVAFNGGTYLPPNGEGFTVGTMAKALHVKPEGSLKGNPGELVEFTIDRDFPNAAFRILCTRPCQITSVLVEKVVTMNFFRLPTQDPDIAAVRVETDSALQAHSQVKMDIRSLSKDDVSVLAVEAIKSR